jgi:flagellar motor component MotA
MRLLSYLFFLLVGALILMAILSGGSLSTFIDVPSALLVGGPTLLLTLATFCGGDIARSLGCALGSSDIQRDEALLGQKIFCHMSSYALGSASIGLLIGLINMIQNLDDPAAIGPGTATAMLGVFYAIVLAVCVFIPLESSLVNRSGGAIKVKGPNRVVVAGFVLSNLGGLLMFLTLFGSFTS